MPTRAPSRCTKCGTPTSSGRCPQCIQRAHRNYNRRRPPTKSYGPQHRKLRRQVLARDPTCTCPGCPSCTHPNDGCTHPSEHADHHPLSRRQLIDQGRNPNDPRHARGVCAPCHSHKTATQDGGFGHS